MGGRGTRYGGVSSASVASQKSIALASQISSVSAADSCCFPCCFSCCCWGWDWSAREDGDEKDTNGDGDFDDDDDGGISISRGDDDVVDDASPSGSGKTACSMVLNSANIVWNCKMCGGFRSVHSLLNNTYTWRLVVDGTVRLHYDSLTARGLHVSAHLIIQCSSNI